MRKLLWITAFLCVVFFFLNVRAALSQQIYCQSTVTNTREDDLEVGVVLDVEVWVDMGTIQTSGVSFFLTLDNRYLEVEDIRPGEPGFQPFDFSVSAFGENGFQNERQYVQKEGIPYIYLNGHVSATQITKTGKLKVARFKVRATNVVPTTFITVDYNPLEERETVYFRPFQGSVAFQSQGSRLPMTLHIYGIGVEGIPDIFMEPGESNSDIMLDDYVIGTSVPADQFNWTVTGGNANLSTSIDPVTHQVTFQSSAGYTGQEQFIFRVDYGEGFYGQDTTLVTVSYKPALKTENIVPVTFYEDESWIGFLDQMAHDQDHDSTTLVWTVTSLEENIFPHINNDERQVKLTASKDWYGSGEIKFKVSDPYGFSDSLTTTAIVLPVNDPPRFLTPVPDVSFAPGKADSSIILNNYITDVDDPISSIIWTVTGNINVEVALQAQKGYRIVFTAKDGFTGEEEVIVQALDPANAITRDTLIVSVKQQPPQFIKTLPDTVLFSNSGLFHDYVQLSDYVVDTDNALSELSFFTMGDSAISVNISETGQVSFDLSVYNFTLGQERITFYAQDPGGGKDSASALITVIPDNKPYIMGFPEIIYVPVGGSDSSITLNNYIWDADNSNDQITWAYSGNSNITVAINPLTTRLKLSSPNLAFIGEETVSFQAEDPDGNTATVQVLVKVIPKDGTPILTDIPNINITALATKILDLDDYVTIFPAELRDKLVWSWSPQTDDKINIAYNQSTHEAIFSVLDPDFRGTRDFTFTVTNTDSGKSASDDMSVTVTLGKAPILGLLPDIAFVTGTQDSSLKLSRYVIDKDTDLDELEWSVSGNSNILVNTTGLSAGGDHVLRLSNEPGFVGSEVLTITCTDPEGNFATDEITVNVISSTTIDVVVIPNPIDDKFIDITVFSSDTLKLDPTVEIHINDQNITLASNKIPESFAYKSDYMFQSDVSGKVKINVIARDHFGAVHFDTTEFSFGDVSTGKTQNLNVKNVTVSVSPNSLTSPLLYVLEGNPFWAAAELDRTSVVDSWIVGPERKSFNKPALVKVKIPEKYRHMTEFLGLFHQRGETVKKIDSSVDVYGREITAEIDMTGKYLVLCDLEPPEISITSTIVKGRQMTIRYDAEDSKTGLETNSLNVFVNSELYRGNIDYSEGLCVLERDIPWNEEQYSIQLSINDYLENTGYSSVLEVQGDTRPVPDEYKLLQNYPNPFNPETVITYQVPERTYIVLTIFSITGKKVKQIVNEIKDAGIYQVRWNGENSLGRKVSSGIYIYRLSTKEYSCAKRMVLLK